MTKETLPDLHNRRRNIVAVSQRAKRHRYPYLAWPEDVALLRLEDIPELEEHRMNIPPSWRICELNRIYYPIAVNLSINRFIKPGFAYSKHIEYQFGYTAVFEYKVESR